MKLKRRPREKKVASGIALKPSLWARIDGLAILHEKSRNQVMEEILSIHVPSAVEINKLVAELQDDEEQGVFNDD